MRMYVSVDARAVLKSCRKGLDLAIGQTFKGLKTKREFKKRLLNKSNSCIKLMYYY